MSEPTFKASFRGPVEQAEITCFAGRCLLEIWLPGDLPREQVRCELLIQPADELGLPAGPPVRVADLSLATRETRRTGQRTACATLPSTFDERLARRCYLRISRCAAADDG